MDGFDHLLKTGLRHSSGDMTITSRKGFFPISNKFTEEIQKTSPMSVAKILQTEAFALYNEQTKGVVVRGIDGKDFSLATGVEVLFKEHDLVIGEELANVFGVGEGDEIALTFAKGNSSQDFLPTVQVFKIDHIVKHGIYQKDLRFVYLKREVLADILGMEDRVNSVIVTYINPNQKLDDLTVIQGKVEGLREKLSADFIVRPFWSEYAFLIEAVKVEKFSISLILQLIVIVAVFNIVAFVIYIMEKKSMEFFFLRAIGLTIKQLMWFWLISIFNLWILACVGAFFLTKVFNWSLANISYFQIPGEIYVLSSLQLILDGKAYYTVYGLSLIWIILAAAIGYWRFNKKSIMQGLREEFS